MSDTGNYYALTKAIENYYGSSDVWNKIGNAAGGIDTSQAAEILSQVPGVSLKQDQYGNIINIVYNKQIPVGTSDSIGTIIDSNTQTGTALISRNIEVPAAMAEDAETGKLVINSGVNRAHGFSQGLNFIATEIIPAVAAAGSGITIGKAIDGLLYSANPEFWDSHNMATLNPETWSSITIDAGPAGNLFNALIGLNPETNNSQLYISEDALAYSAYYMGSTGALYTENSKRVQDAESLPVWPQGMPGTFPITSGSNFPAVVTTESGDHITLNPGRFGDFEAACCEINGTGRNERYHILCASYNSNPGYAAFTYDNKTVYYLDLEYSSIGDYGRTVFINPSIPVVSNRVGISNEPLWSDNPAIVAWSMLYGSVSALNVDGINDQDSAKTPYYNPETWTSPQNTKTILQSYYPELWDNSVEIDTVQPDGSFTTVTYIPVGTPETTNRTDKKPITGDASQDDTTVGPESPGEQQRTLTDPATDGNSSPPNPPDTGTGDGPVSILPTGEASALWTIYNPTQAQLNSFGGWLWSTNFVDQLKKLFNDPMQSIIGVSKVFAPPPVSGNGTIVVGYLDSNVPSNIVGAQYSTVDCGTVAVSEYFGNVFDYDPFTNISIYLPFIGIKQLNVSDVMRSYINVTYHVDVLSGACLADVNVIRDGNSAGLYQFAGNAAVQYPVSSGSYMGIVSGVLGVAGAIAGAVATGGAAAVPLLTGAATGLMRSHTQVEHSGSLSGNAGAMGAKKPYLIIERPQTAMAGSFEELQGIPANSYVLLMECTGLTVIDKVHIENIPQATSQELDMIETALKDGVII